MKKQFFKVWMACMLMGFPFMAWAQTNETLVATYSLTRYVDDSPGDEDDGSPEYPYWSRITNFDPSIYEDGHYYRFELTFTINEEEGGEEVRTQDIITTRFVRETEWVPYPYECSYILVEETTEYFDLDDEEGIDLYKSNIAPIYEYDDATGISTIINLDEVNSWTFVYWLGHSWELSDVVLRIYEVQQ